MAQVLFEVPQESLLAFKGSEEQAGREVLMAAAVKFYEMGHMSSGAAARLAGVPRTVFLTRLADYCVDTFKYDKDEFEKETRLA